MELIVTPRTSQTMLLKPGLTIWRPVFHGHLWTPRVIPSKTGTSNYVKTKFRSVACYINEPSVNHYNKDDNIPYGITTFLLDTENQPARELPENWFALRVTGVNKTGLCIYATPLVTDCISLYVSFRHELAAVYHNPELATQIDFIQGLQRLYVEETDDRASYRYTYFQ